MIIITATWCARSDLRTDLVQYVYFIIRKLKPRDREELRDSREDWACHLGV